MYHSLPKIEKISLSDIPVYTGGYHYCLVNHVDPNTKAKYERLISDEDAAFLRNLWYNHKTGLKYKTFSLSEKVRSLENKGLVDRKSRRFYLSNLAINAEYTLVPRIVPID